MLSGTSGALSGGIRAGTPEREAPRDGGRGASRFGSGSSSRVAVSRSGSPIASVAWEASTAMRGGRFAYHSSFGRPKPSPVFRMMVSSSISHSGCSHPIACCSLPLWRTVQTSPSSNETPMSPGTSTANSKRWVRG